MKALKTEPADRFAALRVAVTNSEIGAAIAGLNDDLERLLQEHSEAERARDQAILEGKDALALRTRVTNLATEIADLRMAIEAAEQRRTEAERREADTALQDKAAEAKALGAELGATYRRFDAAIAGLREEHANVDRLREKLSRVNGSLEVGGHPELRVKADAIRQSIVGDERPATRPGLSRSGQRIDELLRDLGTPRMAIRINPRHRRLHGNATPLPAA
jgi:predicted RNase H-like nuclease (RuvC/YqgF family)